MDVNSQYEWYKKIGPVWLPGRLPHGVAESDCQIALFVTNS